MSLKQILFPETNFIPWLVLSLKQIEIPGPNLWNKSHFPASIPEIKNSTYPSPLADTHSGIRNCSGVRILTCWRKHAQGAEIAQVWVIFETKAKHHLLMKPGWVLLQKATSCSTCTPSLTEFSRQGWRSAANYLCVEGTAAFKNLSAHFLVYS